MGLLKRLKKLLPDERGNALALGAAALPLIIGGAGLALDTVQISLAKRQLQRAADSAALAGARSVARKPARPISMPACPMSPATIWASTGSRPSRSSHLAKLPRSGQKKGRTEARPSFPSPKRF